MKTAVIVQARMGSKRFPGKVMASLGGRLVVSRVIDRCRDIGQPVILAVPVGEYWSFPQVLDKTVSVTTGSESDVLSRYLSAAIEYDVDLIMRITADCPLLDPELCKNVLALYHEGGCSYAAIGEGRTFAKGLGCEVFSRFTLQLANELATDSMDREHVTPWMERNVRCKYLTQDKDESHLNYCVDYPEDIARLEKIMQKVTPAPVDIHSASGEM